MAGDPVAGLNEVNQLSDLGGPSFASKHLRFLAPAVAVILDSVISSRLGYALNLTGYRMFLTDCARVAEEVNASGLKHPYRSSGPWYVSDIELAVFAKLQGFECPSAPS